MSFEARYGGCCPACDEGIYPGQEVEYNEDHELVHLDCLTPPLAAEDDPDEACTHCWTVHAGDCL